MATTIQITNKTLERLKYFKAYSKESYDEILNKILNTYEENELTADAIRDVQTALESVAAGKGESLSDVASEFGVKL